MPKGGLIYPFLLCLIFSGRGLFAGDIPDRDYIYYETEERLYQFGAPEGWYFDIENAQSEGKSAIILPEGSNFYKFDMVIYIWIYSIEVENYWSFITRDSLRLIKEYPGLEFSGIDSVFYDSTHYSLYLETADPGGPYDIAFMGYIKAGEEMMIYQCDIKDRYYLAEAQARFREALARFRVVKRNTEN